MNNATTNATAPPAAPVAASTTPRPSLAARVAASAASLAASATSLGRSTVLRETWQTRSCACRDPEQCKAFMKQWAELGSNYKHMLQYVFIPIVSKKSAGVAAHTNHYRETALHHLLGRNSTTASATDELSQGKLCVAMHHFKPSMRAAAQRSIDETKRIDKYRCSKDEGDNAGLTARDLCRIRSKTKPDLVYYLVPSNVNYEDIKHELLEAQGQVRIEASASIAPPSKRKRTAEPFTTPQPQNIHPNIHSNAGPIEQSMRKKYTSTVSTCKKTPAERAFESTCREMVATPQKYALEMQQLQSQMQQMKLQIASFEEMQNRMIEAHKVEMEEQKAEYEFKISMTGLNRMSILNPKWHDKWKWMSNYLFGFEKWDHFKSFARLVLEVDVEVTGCDDFIQDFEKVCMCAMFVRRAFRRGTFGGIYGRSPAAITGYLQEWMPKLGRVGHSLTELPFEKTHNFLTEEQARELKTKFILEDGTVVDFADA